MSGTVSQDRHSGRPTEVAATADAGAVPRRGRVRWAVAAVAAVAAVVAGGVAAAWGAGVFHSAASSGGQQAPAPATSLVKRQDLSSVTPVSATLGYAGSYTVRGQGGGAVTWLPSPGQVIGQGQALYWTDITDPVVLLYGSIPAWRTLDEGVTGADVSQLNHDLVRLGDASRPEIRSLGWDYFSWQTKAGVEKLQSALGVASPPGSLSLGQVVFEPAALRVATVPGSLGSPASGPVLTATSDWHVVTIALDVSQQSEVKAGDTVSITLPDGASTPGVVTSVGRVATAPSGPGSSGSTPTIPVMVKLTSPQAAGRLDQAPVTVNITTATAHDVLVVPVTALLARSSGGYAVEVAGVGNTRRLVPVTPGIFDDADGLVQVTGNLRPGQRVVVPAS